MKKNEDNINSLGDIPGVGISDFNFDLKQMVPKFNDKIEVFEDVEPYEVPAKARVIAILLLCLMAVLSVYLISTK